MKIYTRTGDKGQTSLLGGKRVSKSNIRIEAYGTIDELNSYLGLIRDHEEIGTKKADLINIQETLFTIGSHLAVEPGKSFDYIPAIDSSSIEYLESLIDRENDGLPEMKNFVIPGGHKLVSLTHIARTICRKAERRVVELAENSELYLTIIGYLNRLSDYLFVLARRISFEEKAEEIPWKPRESNT